ncbi:uncharacterized protein LOC121517726 isoform X2 [Cheilinus undulatus]|uniref:uncharacterized protein LOC121517726 isoform X2 n=1 Tax=Cheilinus undulatus TaxID=241271 RepID=UPI001BD5EA53|nr:uncharacterized protein LOC121517726 isoform X2 [Cheilinus undulatus]
METKETVISNFDQLKVVFVLDGLDALKPPLDFDNINQPVEDVQQSAPVDVLLTNLIRGTLLPSARLWITSQPSAANQLPDECVNRQTEIRDKGSKQKLTTELKKRILSEHESKVRGLETDTNLFEIHEHKVKGGKIDSWSALFPDLEKTGGQRVLTKGVPGVGKTYQTLRFMVDWANKKANQNIDFVVPLDLSELNSRKPQVQNMKDLLHHSLSSSAKPGVLYYDEVKVLFILDGLERCELPLDFAHNKDLTDMEEPASMDELLTNLIKGNLFPSAHIWIISQPSGVDKIPPEYIQKVTECQETLERRRKLISALRESFGQTIQEEDLNHFNVKNTEHITREVKRNETTNEETKDKTQVNAVADIFKDSRGKTTKTVLTVGVKNIGKSFHVERLIKQWTENANRSVLTWPTDPMMGRAKEDEVIFPLNLSRLNSIRDKKVSLLELLNHFFEETKETVISNFDQLKVVFVLDGLDALQPPFEFDNDDTLTDVQQSASIDVLLTNLIRGTLLPSARLWITSRPPAAEKLPDECVDRRTEIRYTPDLESQWNLKFQLKDQFTHVKLGLDMEKTSTLLNDIYTDLYIIEGERGEVNMQHETKQIEGAKFKPQETSIKYNAIFKPSPGNSKHIKSVLTTGMAGIGKSFATMKYMLDWAEDKSHTDIFFMFPLSFRELNLRKDDEHSLEELIFSFFPGMKTSEIKDYDKYKILIVLDGFDECRLDVDFSESEYCRDVRKKTSVKVLLANLIKRNLLPEAQVWITSRPAASNSIPADKVDRVTEVRGFNDDQKEEYFRKRFDDQELTKKILSHVKNSRSLYIMCHIPVFCWLTSKVLEDFVKRKEEGKMPSTLTAMYIHFFLIQCRQANVKYGTGETSENSEPDSCWNQRNKTTAVSLGKLAFEGLEKGDLVFTEETLTECGVNITEAAVFSGVFTQIKREDSGLYQQKLFCFAHMSIQEFMAAFYVFHTFNNEGLNLLTTPPPEDADKHASDFFKTAVDKALGSKNGDWDLFLRFLLGISLERSRTLLKDLLKQTENSKETNKKTIAYIKDKIREEEHDSEQKFNLFHCLNELNDQSLVEEVKKYLHSETGTFGNVSASELSALSFVLLTSDKNLDVFDLKKYRKSDKVLLGMLPVVKVAKTASLSWCELTEKSCNGLSSSILSSASCNLTELDLSHNDLLDSGVKFIADGLKSLHCKLETLKLSGCQVTEKGCSFLASALEFNTASTLKHLDLSYNHPGAEGERLLSAIAEDPKRSLKTLCFDYFGEHRLKPGMKKYDGCLKLDENTASKRLVLSEGNRMVKTVRKVKEKVQREENEERFKRSQVFCEEGLKGLCYWEVEWKGTVGIAVAYKEVGRKWDRKSGMGCNDMSWSLLCSKDGYTAIHGTTSIHIKQPFSQKIAVLLDWEAGTLTYCSDTSGELSPIHTFRAKFTEPVYPGFWFKWGCVTLCETDKTSIPWSELMPQLPEQEEKAEAKVAKFTVPQKCNLKRAPEVRYNRAATTRIKKKGPQRMVQNTPAPSEMLEKSAGPQRERNGSKDNPVNFSQEESGPPVHRRQNSPSPSVVSMISNLSKDMPLDFKKEGQGAIILDRPDSPSPSVVSMKSDLSKDMPLDFNKEGQGAIVAERPDSPSPSVVSMKSDLSKDMPLDFNKEGQGAIVPERPDSPSPSVVSMKSDLSKDMPLDFNKEGQGAIILDRPDSPSPSVVSMKSDLSKDMPLDFSKEGQSAIVPEKPDSPSPREIIPE